MTEAVLLKQVPPLELAPEVKQRRASDPETSVWVNASAGSGKTTVLTNRVMRLLLDGVKPERILCLTYTRAAAAEMAIRITDKLSRWATCSDNDLNASIGDLQGYAPSPEQMTEARRLFARILSCPGGMRIRTIHAFCQEILRRFPIEAGLPPHFTVIEETDARALQEEAQTDLLQRAAADPGDALGQALKVLVLNLGEHGFTEAMRSSLMERPRLQAAIAKAGSVENLVMLVRDQLQLAPEDSYETICHAAVQDRVIPKTELQRVGEALGRGLKTSQKLGRVILKFLALMPVDRQAAFTDYADVFFTQKGEFLKKYADKQTLAACAEAEEILSREAARLQSVRERLETAQLAETTAATLVFGSALIEQFEKRKTAQAALDYDDLIIRTDALLRRPGIAPWILFKLDGGIDHMLVDEAQDTSRAQWSIVAALADEFFAGLTARTQTNRTLFVVGDEKQSIFSFQRADPEAFRQMRDYFSRRINEAEKKYDEVPMRVSFRSAPAILQAVDKVFAAAHVVSGVSVEPVEHLPVLPRVGDPPKIGRVEVWPLQPAPKKEEADEDEWQAPLGYEKEQDPQAELAQQIAGKIKNLLDQGECAAGDVMILLRRRGRFADLMVRALKERNVPVTGVDRMRLIQQLPVMDLLALLQFVLLPEDDLNLATVMRGPLLGLSEDDLMNLAIGREGTLWQRLNELQGKPAYAAACSYLSAFLAIADFTTPFALLVKILNETCPGSAISGKHALWQRLGLDALDPIEELLNAAQNFSRRHTPSLQNFLHWLMATEADIKRELDRSGGQVRIMTVHASKGLEAPIVFLPDSASVPRMQDIPKFLWGRDDLPLYASRRPTSGMPRSLWETGRQKQMEEYRRLLYVALTRAAKQLYIVGWEAARKEPNSEQSWYNIAKDALQDLHQPAATQTEPQPEIVFADPDFGKVKKKTSSPIETASKQVLPDWIRKSPPEEQRAIKVAVPSQAAQAPATATPDSVFARGRIIHRLLESLPSVEIARRAEVAARFLANPQHQLSQAQQNEIRDEVLNILTHPDYAPLFGPDSRAEVPLVGHVKGQAMSGQVDRLCMVGDEVWIVDYKTNRPPPESLSGVPEIYRQQLAAYRAILQEIYPGKAIRCFLLWTYKLRFMELPADFLCGT